MTPRLRLRVCAVVAALLSATLAGCAAPTLYHWGG